MVMFALNDIETFDQLEYWMSQIEQETDNHVLKILIGTKCDLF